jgi:hypothetical protein
MTRRSRDPDARPRLLCVMQLPPPVHGASTVNQNVASSDLLAAHFVLDVMPLRFADTIGDIGQVSFKKLAKAVSIAAELSASGCSCAGQTPSISRCHRSAVLSIETVCTSR